MKKKLVFVTGTLPYFLEFLTKNKMKIKVLTITFLGVGSSRSGHHLDALSWLTL
jgi:hypothetical protein